VVHVIGTAQFGTGMHGVQTEGAGNIVPWKPALHSLHSELNAVVHVIGTAQPATGVHGVHEPGLPVTKELSWHDVQSFAVGPLQVAHDGLQSARAALLHASIAQTTTSTATRGNIKASISPNSVQCLSKIPPPRARDAHVAQLERQSVSPPRLRPVSPSRRAMWRCLAAARTWSETSSLALEPAIGQRTF